MATYYKHKATQSKRIPYSFECEHCGQESGPLTATISAEATQNSAFNKLKPEQSERLNNEALDNLKKSVGNIYAGVTEKQTYALEFKNKCPACGEPQSWGISGLKNDQWTMPIVIFVVGVLVALGCYFFTDVMRPTLSYIIGIGGAVIAAGVLIQKKAVIAAHAKKAAAAPRQNLPNIEWDAVKDLITL